MWLFDYYCFFIGKLFLFLVVGYAIISILGWIFDVFKGNKELRGRKVLVTGGANGLGKVLASKFLNLGCTVIIWDIDEDSGKKVVEEFSKKFPKSRVYFDIVDISSKRKVSTAAEKIRKEVGSIDVLFNNAGIVEKKSLFDCSEGLARRVMDVNCLSHFWMCKEFVQDLRKSEDGGHIVCVSSVSGLLGIANLQIYTASKFANFGFTESLRNQFKIDGINIDTLTVCPGHMEGSMFDKFRYLKIAPPLSPSTVADQIIVAMEKRRKELIIPGHLRYFNYTIRLLFHEIYDTVQTYVLYTDHAMDDIVNDQEKTKES